ncbi:MAG: histidine phosphatase family protein [Candidatus Diapherotrites archaeon]|nr:histidine phosphatase family protein [Candidatus Diapherotrites archaeon]
MKIWLARHGQCFSNNSGRFTGKTDSRLSPLGRKTAKKVGKFLKKKIKKADIIYSSPLRRAKDSAKIIARLLKCKSVLIEKSLGEQSFGLWEKKTGRQVEARWPGSIAAWLKDPFKVTPEKGENYSGLEKRLLPFAKKIKSLPCKNVVIVSHANIRRVLAKILLRLSEKQALLVSKDYDAIILIEPNKRKMKTFKA